MLIQELRGEGNLVVPINGERVDAVVLEVMLVLQFTAYPPVKQGREVKSPLFSVVEMNDERVIIQVVCL